MPRVIDKLLVSTMMAVP